MKTSFSAFGWSQTKLTCVHLLKCGFLKKSFHYECTFFTVIRIWWDCCCTHQTLMTWEAQLTRSAFIIKWLPKKSIFYIAELFHINNHFSDAFQSSIRQLICCCFIIFQIVFLTNLLYWHFLSCFDQKKWSHRKNKQVTFKKLTENHQISNLRTKKTRLLSGAK